MSPEREPFARALSALRETLRQSDFVESAPLTIVDTARALGLSPTPVREALAWLAGQGSITEDHRGRGYATHRLDAFDVAELYDLQGLYMGAACARAARAERPVALPERHQAEDVTLRPDGGDVARATQILFDAVVAASGAGLLATRHASLQDRLHPLRRQEGRVIAEVHTELAELHRLATLGNWSALSTALGAYHRRRRNAAEALVRSAREIPKI